MPYGNVKNIFISILNNKLKKNHPKRFIDFHVHLVVVGTVLVSTDERALSDLQPGRKHCICCAQVSLETEECRQNEKGNMELSPKNKTRKT